MIVLAIDTATADVVTGIVDTESGAVVDHVIPGVRGHNEHLVPAIQQVLADASLTFADLDAVVVGQGPGPFTSLRIGMVTATAIGQARGLPVYGVTTHDAIAARVAEETGASRVLVVTDARRKEIYWASYEDGVRTAGPDVRKPADLEVPHEVDVASVPEGLAGSVLVNAPQVDLTPRARGLVAAADFSQKPEAVTPHYLRRPDATPPTSKPLSPAIPDVKL